MLEQAVIPGRNPRPLTTAVMDKYKQKAHLRNQVCQECFPLGRLYPVLRMTVRRRLVPIGLIHGTIPPHMGLFTASYHQQTPQRVPLPLSAAKSRHNDGSCTPLAAPLRMTLRGGAHASRLLSWSRHSATCRSSHATRFWRCILQRPRFPSPRHIPAPGRFRLCLLCFVISISGGRRTGDSQHSFGVAKRAVTSTNDSRQRRIQQRAHASCLRDQPLKMMPLGQRRRRGASMP